MNNKINFSMCTFLKRSILENSQSGPKNKIDAKNSKKYLITLYSFMFLHKNGTFWRWPFFSLFLPGITLLPICHKWMSKYIQLSTFSWMNVQIYSRVWRIPFFDRIEYRILFGLQKSPNTECWILFSIEKIRIPNTIQYQENPNTE